MFTGIVEAVGIVRDVVDHEETRRFRITDVPFANDLKLGQSVSVDGACLTVTEHSHDGFAVDVIGTTLERTIAGSYLEGTRVNLERAAKLGDRLDGHIVQGHVDGIGHLISSQRSGEYWLLDFRLPLDVYAQTIEHGSITLNGVSLTVSEMLPESAIRVGIIPHTHEHTNLGGMDEGAAVNVEGDLVGKYIDRLLESRREK